MIVVHESHQIANATNKDFFKSQNIVQILKRRVFSDIPLSFREIIHSFLSSRGVFVFFFMFSQPGIRCFNASSYILWFAWWFRSLVFHNFGRLALR